MAMIPKDKISETPWAKHVFMGVLCLGSRDDMMDEEVFVPDFYIVGDDIESVRNEMHEAVDRVVEAYISGMERKRGMDESDVVE